MRKPPVAGPTNTSNESSLSYWSAPYSSESVGISFSYIAYQSSFKHVVLLIPWKAVSGLWPWLSDSSNHNTA